MALTPRSLAARPADQPAARQAPQGFRGSGLGCRVEGSGRGGGGGLRASRQRAARAGSAACRGQRRGQRRGQHAQCWRLDAPRYALRFFCFWRLNVPRFPALDEAGPRYGACKGRELGKRVKGAHR